MYSAVLVAALVTTSTTPAWCHRGSCGCYSGYSGYAGYAGYAGYSGYGCYGCHGCHGYIAPAGYGAAGGCYGYHGGCYSGFGVTSADPWHVSTGCYGCYGGHSGYGVPLPGTIVVPVKRPVIVDPFPPINPKKEGGAEEIGPLKEKKKDDKKPEESVRAKLSIEVPEGGKLFVDGQPIATKAGTRVFQTPDLKPGQTYYYDIRIEVERNGSRRGEEQRVVVQAGQDAFLNFPTLRPAGTLAAQGNR